MHTNFSTTATCTLTSDGKHFLHQILPNLIFLSLYQTLPTVIAPFRPLTYNFHTENHIINKDEKKMSGGVGPPCDITLPTDEPHEEPYAPKSTSTAGRKPPPSRRSFLTFRQLNALAVAVVLSASGMVTVQDISFVVFSIFYFFFISRVAFPTFHDSQSDPPIFQNPLLSTYAAIGSLIGLFLPVAYICEGVYEGDKEGIKAAAPHVFLLASQVFMEGVAISGRFSLPVRVIVPVVYNSMRVLSIMEWVRNEISKIDVGYGGNVRRLSVGRGLAVVNMAYWSFNLFGFLLPFYMPRAFKMYYSKVKD
ncbi:hypothetical protein OROGR_016056 [Orobanche gracilis]